MTAFEKYREKCPWFYRATSHAHERMCWAVQEQRSHDCTCGADFGLDCIAKNCAVWYWLKIIGKEK